MENYFRYMASEAGRIVKGCIGFAIIAWGYSNYSYPFNLLLMAIGTVVTLLAIYNILFLAPLFGYPVSGQRVIDKYGPINGVPGEDPSGKLAVEGYHPESGSGEQYSVKAKSTVQGGSNYGQGSMQLGAGSYRQGSVKNSGANYKDEQAFSGRENTDMDDQPHKDKENEGTQK
jgi:hypothetical protein